MKKRRSITPDTALRLAHYFGTDVRQAQRNQWLADNKIALDEYNRRIEPRGVFSDGLRRF